MRELKSIIKSSKLPIEEIEKEGEDHNQAVDKNLQKVSVKVSNTESLTTLSSSVNSEFCKLKPSSLNRASKAAQNYDSSKYSKWLLNPFTSVYTSRFTCLECQNYTWEKHEIRYVITGKSQIVCFFIVFWIFAESHCFRTVPCSGPTIEQCIKKDLRSEIIEDYQCIKWTITDTLLRIKSLRVRYGDSIPPIKDLVLIEEELLLNKFVDLDFIDEDEFKKWFVNFSNRKQNNRHLVKLSKPKCRIAREHILSKAPKILWIHLNRLADFDHFGNMRKNQNYIKFSKTIDLSDCFGEQFKHKYELKSVVEHLGGPNSGHFIVSHRLS